MSRYSCPAIMCLIGKTGKPPKEIDRTRGHNPFHPSHIIFALLGFPFHNLVIFAEFRLLCPPTTVLKTLASEPKGTAPDTAHIILGPKYLLDLKTILLEAV